MPLIEVKYKGLSDERTITKKNWDQEGVSIPVDTTWNHANRHTLLIDANDRMIEVLKAQGHFQISEVTDTGGRTVLAEATDAFREADIVVDGNTGQRSVVKKTDGPAETTVPTGGNDSAGTGSGTKGKGSSTSGDA